MMHRAFILVKMKLNQEGFEATAAGLRPQCFDQLATVKTNRPSLHVASTILCWKYNISTQIPFRIWFQQVGAVGRNFVCTDLTEIPPFVTSNLWGESLTMLIEHYTLYISDTCICGWSHWVYYWWSLECFFYNRVHDIPTKATPT